MQFGFAPVQSQHDYREMISQSQLAEELGFDVIWAHEHHSQEMMYPDPLMALAVLAPHIKRARLGTNMLLLPEWHPLRVAEQAAMVDVLSEGRLILGMAAGYVPDEFAAFGADIHKRGRLMDHGLELIRTVFFGDQFRIDGYRLFPRPVQSPPPIYVGGLAPPVDHTSCPAWRRTRTERRFHNRRVCRTDPLVSGGAVGSRSDPAATAGNESSRSRCRRSIRA